MQQTTEEPILAKYMDTGSAPSTRKHDKHGTSKHVKHVL